MFAVISMAIPPVAAAGPAVTTVETASPNPVTTTYVVRADHRTGKLIRIPVQDAVLAEKRRNSPPPRIKELVDQSAQAHHVDPLLVHSVIQAESNYDSAAVSPKGAEGLMQLMPSTARMLGVSNTFDPSQNIEAGVKYLKYLQDLYKDDRMALAAYNAGPGAVDKFKRVPPYPETRKYVEKISRSYSEAKAVEKATAAAQPKAAVTAPDAAAAKPEYSKLEQFVDEDGRLHLKTAD